jgi:hypothetical protein
LQSFERTLGILAIPGLQTLERLFDLSIHQWFHPTQRPGIVLHL